MVSIVQNNLPEIIKTCKEMHVKSLYLFGSGARGNDFSSKSDLDFLYTSVKDAEGLPLPPFDYFDLLYKLEEITGKEIDLVAETKIKNKYFLERVLAERIPIYES